MDGFINLDKESGLSSHQAVAAVRRLLSCKAGHAGTLDPLASGVLPLCLGKATRLSEYVMGQQKLYLTRIRLGVETDSYDAAGAVLAERDASQIRQEDIQALLPRFYGRIMQKPPLISALKRDGLPLYKRARRGETVEVEARPVEIYAIELVGGSFGGDKPYVELQISCGKGAYIRSIAHDLGELLGVGAYVAALRRLSVGPFKAENAYTLRQIEEMQARGEQGFILPLNYGLAHLPCYIAPPASWPSLRHGNEWRLEQKDAGPLPLCRVETAEGQLLGIGHIGRHEQGGLALHMDKVLLAAEAELVAEAEDNALDQPYSVVAIGNFDGVHLGHKELLRRMYLHKQRLGGLSAALTFTPHPLQLINGQTPPLLNTAAEKRRLLLEEGGVDGVVELRFDEQLRQSSPERFVEDVIVERSGARQVVVGFNFRFGAGGAGDAATLKRLAATRGIGVEIVEAVSGPYGLVSSSAIRRFLQAGNIEAANSMLGYMYELSGQVVKGCQLGRELGFPTANFPPAADLVLPPCGVYAVRVLARGSIYDGVANFGYKPTVSDGATMPLVEAHLFDVEPELYGQWITVRFGHFLREEKHFASLAELTAQISADSQAARRFWAQASKLE